MQMTILWWDRTGQIETAWEGAKNESVQGTQLLLSLAQSVDLLEPLLRGNDAEKAKGLVTNILKLVLLILSDINDIPALHLVDLPPQEDPGLPFQYHDSLVMEVLFKRGLTAGRDLEVTDGEVLCPLLWSDEDVATTPLAGPTPVVGLRGDSFPFEVSALADLLMDNTHGTFLVT